MTVPQIQIGFLGVMAVLAFIDFRTLELPNVVLFPLAALGVMLTGNWLWMIALFLIGAGLFGFRWECPHCHHVEVHEHKFSIHRGGDVKLFAVIGAFMGIKALPICLVGYLLIAALRTFCEVPKILPATPFLWVAAIVCFWF